MHQYECLICHSIVVTSEFPADAGLPPDTIKCGVTPGCTGIMPVDPDPAKLLPITHEWRKPRLNEAHRLTKALRAHVLKGGYLLFALPQTTKRSTAIAQPRPYVAAPREQGNREKQRRLRQIKVS